MAAILGLAFSVPQLHAVKIGVLHSLSGTMAISETSLRDVVMMAVEEINADGGVLGEQVEAVVVDPASDWPLFAEKAKQLITEDKVAVTFGCWTSVSRKSCLPVFEENNALLFYPVQYEGEEQSLNVFYTAASPNQQLVPAAEYMANEMGCKKFYLLGTDYVFPRTANKVLKAYLKAQGVPDENVMEEYTPFHHQDYQTIVSKVKEFAASGDACILSTINGDSNVPFYKEFANQGLTSDDCPIMAFSVSEDELRAMDVPPLVGHLAAWNYFQSVKSPENAAFVKAFKKYCVKAGLPGGANALPVIPSKLHISEFMFGKLRLKNVVLLMSIKFAKRYMASSLMPQAVKSQCIQPTNTPSNRFMWVKSLKTECSKSFTIVMV